MSTYNENLEKINRFPSTWLITGVAGFIGSNLLEKLLIENQTVIGLDNFIRGHKKNLEFVREAVGEEKWKNFIFVEGDIRDLQTCHQVCENVDYVLHQAALGSVPFSIENPIIVNECNNNGFLNMLVAARDAKVKNFVYATSSSTYGTDTTLPKQEACIGSPLSPYAVTKYINELYADVFSTTYGLNSIGLRYFNVFGKRQDPNGAYAAVIPLWYTALLEDKPVYINGDGETSRDFCYIDNVVQMNILAALSAENGLNKVYNVAFGESITLNELYEIIRQEALKYKPQITQTKPVYREFRKGDIRHSLADISLAQTLLGYAPKFNVKQGLERTAAWYASLVK